MCSSIFSFQVLEFQLSGSETSSPGQAPPARLDVAQEGSGIELGLLEMISWFITKSKEWEWLKPFLSPVVLMLSLKCKQKKRKCSMKALW